MSIAIMVVQIVMLVASAVLIVSVLMQSTKSAGLGGAFGGDTQSFTPRGRAASKEAKLQKLTVICAIVVGILAIAIMILTKLAA